LARGTGTVDALVRTQGLGQRRRFRLEDAEVFEVDLDRGETLTLKFTAEELA
jgi:hypothetical protein